MITSWAPCAGPAQNRSGLASGSGVGGVLAQRRVQVGDDPHRPARRVRRRRRSGAPRTPRAGCGPRGPRRTGRSRDRAAAPASRGARRPAAAPGRRRRSPAGPSAGRSGPQAMRRPINRAASPSRRARSPPPRTLARAAGSRRSRTARARRSGRGARSAAPRRPATPRRRPAEQRGGDPLPPRRPPDRQPAELGGRADQQDPAGGEQLAVAHGDQVDALGVAAVELVALGHALLDAEHVVAELERRRQLLAGCGPGGSRTPRCRSSTPKIRGPRSARRPWGRLPRPDSAGGPSTSCERGCDARPAALAFDTGRTSTAPRKAPCRRTGVQPSRTCLMGTQFLLAVGGEGASASEGSSSRARSLASPPESPRSTSAARIHETQPSDPYG